MGTMCNQNVRPRRELDLGYAGAFSNMIKELAKKQNITYDQALKTYELMAYERRTDIMIDNGDFTDENMCGIGSAIKDISDQLHDVAEALEEIARGHNE